MGVKTKLSLSKLNQLQQHFHFTSLQESISGITDTTYFVKTNMNEMYVLKLYEQASVQAVEKEVQYLGVLKDLKVTKALTSFLYENKPIVVFSYIQGESPSLINEKQLHSLSHFLAKMHDHAYMKKSNKTDNILKRLIKEVELFEDAPLELLENLKKRYELVKNIDLDFHSCIIHGDIFPDNTKFKDNTLMGVYDFSQVSIGSRYLDIGIVCNNWCFVNGKFNDTLFNGFWERYKAYSLKHIEEEHLKVYCLYSALLFAVNRYLNIYKYETYNKTIPYEIFLDKFDEINQFFGYLNQN